MVDAINILDLLVKIAQVVGIPVGVWVYAYNKRRERQAREYATYHALDEKYIDYLRLCLENDDLDVADHEMDDPPKRTPAIRHRELLVFTILISILERAFLMYKGQADPIRKKQWSGWEDYTASWFDRENFQEAWDKLGQFDEDFLCFMSELQKRHRSLTSE